MHSGIDLIPYSSSLAETFFFLSACVLYGSVPWSSNPVRCHPWLSFYGADIFWVQIELRRQYLHLLFRPQQEFSSWSFGSIARIVAGLSTIFETGEVHRVGKRKEKRRERERERERERILAHFQRSFRINLSTAFIEDFPLLVFRTSCNEFLFLSIPFKLGTGLLEGLLLIR